MSRKMLIDAALTGEVRLAVTENGILEEFDYEQQSKAPLKGNIYLAKVTRVEPSLQAAFVDYGTNRHGFLAFSEIHPDYFRVPVGDLQLMDNHDEHPHPEPHDMENTDGDEYLQDLDANDDAFLSHQDLDEEENDANSDIDNIDDIDNKKADIRRQHARLKRMYKIQEVIKRGQVMLIQVVKEERGNKGAALTTYLSIAGRYCVLMPNTSRGGGISRKISNQKDRRRLKDIVDGLGLPDGMGLILRTAGGGRTKLEIRRDFDYISGLWDKIRARTLESTAPAHIHAEGNLINRAVRDTYTKETDEIIVAGQEGYKACKEFMKALIPSHAKKVKEYKNENNVSLFNEYGIEQQLKSVHNNIVSMKSGGFLVINQTEALVAIDVNSGRATRERHIEETALKTNIEAAQEVARQLRLRDLAGLVVIDFIDMEENRNSHTVENKLKEALRHDRARIQVGRISQFGLLEMSRQRLRPSISDSVNQKCPVCDGGGFVQSFDFTAQSLLRDLETEGHENGRGNIQVLVPGDVALYLLNNRRKFLQDLEDKYGLQITIEIDREKHIGYKILRLTNAEGAVVASEENNDDKQGNARHHKDRHFSDKTRKKNNRGRNSRRYSSRGGYNNKKPYRQDIDDNDDNDTVTSNKDVSDSNQISNDAPPALEKRKKGRGKFRPNKAVDKSEMQESPKDTQQTDAEDKTPAKKSNVKKQGAKKSTGKKTAAKKTGVKKATAKKAAAKKAAAKKTATKKADTKDVDTTTPKAAEKKKSPRSGWWSRVVGTE